MKVISYKNLPATFPTTSTIANGLLLDRLGAPGWVWGIVGTLFAILWVATIVRMCHDDQVDLLK